MSIEYRGMLPSILALGKLKEQQSAAFSDVTMLSVVPGC